eukprot:1972708-Rhodomonas_salina.1
MVPAGQFVDELPRNHHQGTVSLNCEIKSRETLGSMNAGSDMTYGRAGLRVAVRQHNTLRVYQSFPSQDNHTSAPSYCAPVDMPGTKFSTGQSRSHSTRAARNPVL